MPTRTLLRRAVLLLAASAVGAPGLHAQNGKPIPFTWHGNPASDSAGWAVTSVADGRFQMATDRAVFHGGAASVRLEPAKNNRDGAGTVEQAVRAEPWRGKRVRVRSWLKAQDVTRAVATIAVYGEHEGSILPLRSYSRAAGADVSGTQDWREVEYVIEVPANAEYIAIGYSLIATLATVRDGALVPGRPASGVLWVDDVTMEAVGADAPLSANSVEKVGTRYPDSPERLAGKREWIAKRATALVNGGFEFPLKGKTR